MITNLDYKDVIYSFMNSPQTKAHLNLSPCLTGEERELHNALNFFLIHFLWTIEQLSIQYS